MNSFISCGMASPNIIDASDFASRKFHLNQTVETKADYPLGT